MSALPRIVVTGIGLTAPNGNSLAEYRANLLAGKARIAEIDVRYMGKHPAGVCDYEATRYQKRKEIKNGTRAGSIAIYCAREAVKDSGLNWETVEKSRVGVYVGITEHGNVETENEIHAISQFNYDTKYWTHHHNPRTVANNPAGEVTMNMGVTGPHYTIGAACAAGNAGLIQAAQMLQLGEVDLAIAGGVSESIHTFGIFAGFKNQGALGHHANPDDADLNKVSKPFDKARNGIVISEGGALYTLELPSMIALGARCENHRRDRRLVHQLRRHRRRSPESGPAGRGRGHRAQARQDDAEGHPHRLHARHGHRPRRHPGDDRPAQDFRRLPGHAHQQHEELHRPLHPGAAARRSGARQKPPVVRRPRRPPDHQRGQPRPRVRPAPWLVINTPRRVSKVDTILNNSFGMLGINSVLIVKRFVA